MNNLKQITLLSSGDKIIQDGDKTLTFLEDAPENAWIDLKDCWQKWERVIKNKLFISQREVISFKFPDRMVEQWQVNTPFRGWLNTTQETFNEAKDHKMKPETRLVYLRKPEELKGIERPIGDFVISQKDLICLNTENGAYYHYADVCTLLSRHLDKRIKELEAEVSKLMYKLECEVNNRVAFEELYHELKDNRTT